MIDYHCHLLPGLDDGAAHRDAALAMASALVDFGFREVCCTPHCIRGQYEFSPVEVREAVKSLQRTLVGAGIPLVLQPGMEYYLDGGFERFAANLLPLGETRLVLCEAPPQVLPGVVAAMLELIVVQGFVPLLAHPERSEVLYRMLVAAPVKAAGESAVQDAGLSEPPTSLVGRLLPSRAKAFLPRGINPLSLHREAALPESCRYQANLGSFTGFYGEVAQRRAYELLQRGTYHCFASDLHDERTAPVILEAALEKLELNPALQKLGAFTAPLGGGGSAQMAFW